MILLGAGGHARVLIDCLRVLGIPIKGILDADKGLHGKKLDGVKILGGDSYAFRLNKRTDRLINAIGSTDSMELRSRIWWLFKNDLKNGGWKFSGLVHPSAVIAKGVRIGEGVQIMAGAIVNAGASIEDNSIINTGAIIEHDVVIGHSCHIGPGAVICGAASIEERTHVGCGAVIIQQRHIGQACTIAAGAVVTKNVYQGVRVAGIPATDMDEETSNTARTTLT